MVTEVDIYRLMSDLSVLAVSMPQTAFYEIVIERVMQVSGFDSAALYVYDHAEKKMIMGAQTNEAAILTPDYYALSVNHQMLTKALGTHTSIDMNVKKTRAVPKKISLILHQNRITHLVVIPLFWHQEPSGVILGFLEKRNTHENKKKYQAISTLCAYALTCSKLFTELNNEHRSQGNILYVLNDGVVTVDTHCTITFWNYAAEKITGLKASEAMGKDCFTVFMGSITDHQGKPLFKNKKDIHHIIDQDTMFKVEGFFRPLGDKQAIFLRIRIAPYREKLGTVSGYILVFENASAQWEIGKLKEDWRSMLTHDLKAPLTATFSSLQILSESRRLAGSDKKLITIALQAYKQLLALINLFLDVQKLSAGALEINPQPFALKKLLKQCMREAMVSAPGKKITFKFILNREYTVRADRVLIQRVINNLLSNAIKSIVHKGVIAIRAVPSTRQRVCVSVTDTGMGIPSEDMPHIFDQFYQTTSKHTYMKSAGAGLGLTFCKQVIKAHGETITVESQPHSGTTFSFTLSLFLL